MLRSSWVWIYILMNTLKFLHYKFKLYKLFKWNQTFKRVKYGIIILKNISRGRGSKFKLSKETVTNIAINKLTDNRDNIMLF